MASKNSNNDSGIGCLICIAIAVIAVFWNYPWLLVIPGIALMIFIIYKINKHKNTKNPKQNIKRDIRSVPSYFTDNNNFKKPDTSQKNSSAQNYYSYTKSVNDDCEYQAKKLKKYTSHKAEEIFI